MKILNINFFGSFYFLTNQNWTLARKFKNHCCTISKNYILISSLHCSTVHKIFTLQWKELSQINTSLTRKSLSLLSKSLNRTSSPRPGTRMRSSSSSVAGQYLAHLQIPDSISRQSITIADTCCCQTMVQKCPTVCSKGPCVNI